MNNFIPVLAIILIFGIFVAICHYDSNSKKEEVEIVKEKIYDTYKPNKPRRNKKTILRYSVK